MELTLYEVARLVQAENDVTIYPDVQLTAIEFDSRKIKQDALFLPLKGQRDGHDFIEKAFENGAAATFSEHPLEGHPYLLVKDNLAAFQRLAKYYLHKKAVDVIAVTGSNGKTTTKDMIASLLATTFPTYKTQGNYNNEIGLPYTILHMPDETEKLVLEMGQDHFGDIDLLSQIAQPRIAVVTMIGEAHLAFFGSRDKIAEGKMQILNGMSDEGLLIAPADPIINAYLPNQQQIVRFGADEDIYLTELIEEKKSLHFKVNFLDTMLTLPVTGKYNATNAMIAAYIAKKEGVSEATIQSTLATIELTKNRTEWKKAANGADILSDVYNANPTAMALILETFSTIPANDGGQKLAVLADMKELGEQSVELHDQIILSLSPEKIDKVIFYGEDIAHLAQLASQMFPPGAVYYFKKTEKEDQMKDLIAFVKKTVKENDQILVKGSNSMSLSKLIEALEK